MAAVPVAGLALGSRRSMTSPAARAGLVVLAGLAGIGVTAVMLGNGVRAPTSIELVLVPLVGWTFLAAGFVAWRIRADNRIGPAMVVTGVLWFASGLYWSQDPLVFSIGHAFESCYLAGIVYVLLAFPTGRLGGRIERLLTVIVFLAAGPAEILFLLLGGHAISGSCPGCPPFVFQVWNAGVLAGGLQLIQHGAGLLAIGLSVGILVRRWRTASAPLRFAIAPVIWSGIVAMPVFAAWVVDQALHDPAGHVVDVALDLALVAIAASFLLGVARTRLARSAVADLMLEINDSLPPGALQGALARTLRDPSLEVAYWLPGSGRFVDAHGAPMALPAAAEERSVTMIERDGRRIAALIHDPALDDEHLVRSACAAAALALENERLQADLRAQLSQVQGSRARLVAAAQDERRRIERDLHDGTQQRLVSLAMTLGLAESKVATDGAAAGGLIADARTELVGALAELRELSQGIHPALLTERGLGAALQDLALRSRTVVDLEVTLDGRLPAAVEIAAYYVVAEALTNVAKHAAAAPARVRVRRQGDRAVLEIADDGPGGADSALGSGLRGLRDRVEALGGSLAVRSPVGGGTSLLAEIPCA